MVDVSADPVVRNPYPGLRPFRTDEEHLFFGREQQVDRMIDKLATHRFLAVVGTSGSGKSSLVNCGLRPALHRGHMASAGADWRMAQMRPGSDPIGALAEALAAPGVLYDAATLAEMATGPMPASRLIALTLRLGSLGLLDMVEQARLPAGTHLLVVADQFEELFRYQAAAPGDLHHGAGEDATAFVQLLLEAATQWEVPIHVVLTMRSDFLGDCAQFRGLPEAINEGQYLVPRLTRDEIRAAITGPAGVASATISPVLLTRLLNDVGDNPDQLSILQHALNRTWFHWETDGAATGPLALVHYDAAGTMSRALDTHANKAFGELPGAAAQRLCERVFKALTDTGTDTRGVRRPKRLAELAEITGAPIAELLPVLALFRKPSRSFLMPPMAEALGPESVIDISHESLMRVWQQLRRWADEEAQSARIYRRLRETALEHAAGNASLWRDPDLRVVLDWRTRRQPTAAWAAMYGGEFDTAMAFLDASRDEQAAELREAEIERRWHTGWGYVPMLMAAVGFMVFHGPSVEWLTKHIKPQEIKVHTRVLVEEATATALVQQLAYVLVGVPVFALYLPLAGWGKRRHHRVQLARMTRQANSPAVDAKEDGPPADQPVVQAVDVHATTYAPVWRRAMAQWADWGACLWLLGLLGLALVSVEGVLGEAGLGFGILLGGALLFWAYHVLPWTGAHRATPGMRLMGVFVTDLQGQPMTRKQATGRFFARLLSYYSAGYGFWLQTVKGRRQTLHDRLSGAVVLLRPADKVRRRPVARTLAWVAVVFVTVTFLMGVIGSQVPAEEAPTPAQEPDTAPPAARPG